MCFSEAFYDTPVKNIPPRKQHMDDTHMVPASSGELPQLQDITGTWQPRSGRAHTLPVPSSLQVPSVSLTSNFTFFLGRILGQLPKHILCIVSALCCHHKGTWDGWRWGSTTEQIQGAWDFPMDMQPVQGTQAKAGQEATQGARAAGWGCGDGATSSHCALIPPHQVPQPARAVLNAAPSAFWGESLIFQGKLDTQGLTLITGSGH